MQLTYLPCATESSHCARTIPVLGLTYPQSRIFTSSCPSALMSWTKRFSSVAKIDVCTQFQTQQRRSTVLHWRRLGRKAARRQVFCNGECHLPGPPNLAQPGGCFLSVPPAVRPGAAARRPPRSQSRKARASSTLPSSRGVPALARKALLDEGLCIEHCPPRHPSHRPRHRPSALSVVLNASTLPSSTNSALHHSTTARR